MRRERFCKILKPRRNEFVRRGRACDKLLGRGRVEQQVITSRQAAQARCRHRVPMQTSAWARYRRIVTIGLSAVHRAGSGLKRYDNRSEYRLGSAWQVGALYRRGRQGAARAVLKFIKPLKVRFKAPLLRLVVIFERFR